MAYESLYRPCKICGGELPNDISSHPVLAECVRYLSEKLAQYTTNEETSIDEIEETEKFVSWKRHEELLQAAKREAYQQGVKNGESMSGNEEWNKGYAKGMDVGYITAQREIISKMKDLLDYDKETAE